MKCNPMKNTSTLLSLTAGMCLFANSASAGGDDNAIFVAADLDLSGSLSLAEFTTTLDAGINARVALRKFRAADRNLDGSVQLTEFLIFTGSVPAPTPAEEDFAEADVDVSGSLSFVEFTATASAKQ